MNPILLYFEEGPWKQIGQKINIIKVYFAKVIESCPHLGGGGGGVNSVSSFPDNALSSVVYFRRMPIFLKRFRHYPPRLSNE